MLVYKTNLRDITNETQEQKPESYWKYQLSSYLMTEKEGNYFYLNLVKPQRRAM